MTHKRKWPLGSDPLEMQTNFEAQWMRMISRLHALVFCFYAPLDTTTRIGKKRIGLWLPGRNSKDCNGINWQSILLEFGMQRTQICFRVWKSSMRQKKYIMYQTLNHLWSNIFWNGRTQNSELLSGPLRKVFAIIENESFDQFISRCFWNKSEFRKSCGRTPTEQK